MEQLIMSLVAGAIGGNAAGKGVKNLDQGTLINSLSGVVGGGLGGSILGMLGSPDMAGAMGAVGGMDLGAIGQQLAGGGVGGAVLLAIVGMIRKKMS